MEQSGGKLKRRFTSTGRNAPSRISLNKLPLTIYQRDRIGFVAAIAARFQIGVS
jgi:hypothetical protein